MLRYDYSDDAELLDYEIDDYDTVDYQEALEAGGDTAGSHPTGINKNRMRLPTRYDISKYYERLKRDRKGEYYNPQTGEYETVTRNKGEYGKWKNRKEELVDFTPDFDWQITYSFPDTLHNNISPLDKVYGGATVTYRRLYLILCERFNEKEYFVDTYFRDVYPQTVKEEVDVYLNNVKDELDMYLYDVVLDGAKLTKRGRLSKAKRYAKQNAPYVKALERYRKFADKWEDTKGNEVAEIIAEDIKRALELGEIPLNNIHTVKTQKKRVQAGYDPDTVFYAFGDLIDHIQLYVKIRR